MDDALRYFSNKRFSGGKGVSQPCQLRLIYYFEAALKNIIVAPTAKKLKCIVVSTVPSFGTDGGCKPFVDITHSENDKLICTTRNEIGQGSSMNTALKYYQASEQAMLFKFEEGEEPVLSGDIHILMKHRGILGDNLICRFAFNTSFVPLNNNLTFYKSTLSPEDLRKDSRISKDILIQLIFEDYCG